jgi:4'-phosphopantetheinyl transferase
VRVILGRHLNVPAESLRWRRGPHGKPALAGSGPQVSLSKSGSLAALAIAAERRVGVDIQRLLAGLDVTRMARRFYPPEEARFVSAAAETAEQVERFTRLWARKEACVKVSGGRLLPGLRLTVLPAGPADTASALGTDLAGSPVNGYQVRDLRVPRGYRAAVAAEGTGLFSITRKFIYLGQRRYQLQPAE